MWAVPCTVCLTSGHVVLGALGLLLLAVAHGGAPRTSLCRARAADKLPPRPDQLRSRTPARTR